MRLPVTRRILGSPSNRRGTRSFFSSALSERWFYQDGGFTGTPSGQRVGEEVALQQQQVARHRLVVGHVRDAKELMRKAVALLMCSWHEAYGRVTVEAMMNDCVVIGRNSGGTSELIEHEETGFLFDSNSELEALMEKVLDMDTTIIRDKAREKAIHSFTEEVYGEQLKKVYDNLLIQNHKTTQE